MATTLFADRLAEAVERKRSQLVVGLDPRPDLLPVELRGDAHAPDAASAEACAAAFEKMAQLDSMMSGRDSPLAIFPQLVVV